VNACRLTDIFRISPAKKKNQGKEQNQVSNLFPYPSLGPVLFGFVWVGGWVGGCVCARARVRDFVFVCITSSAWISMTWSCGF
jgi:hypothetical protein